MENVRNRKIAMETATRLRDTTISSVILWYIRGNIRPSESACSCNLAEYTEWPRTRRMSFQQQIPQIKQENNSSGNFEKSVVTKLHEIGK